MLSLLPQQDHDRYDHTYCRILKPNNETKAGNDVQQQVESALKVEETSAKVMVAKVTRVGKGVKPTKKNLPLITNSTEKKDGNSNQKVTKRPAKSSANNAKNSKVLKSDNIENGKNDSVDNKRKSAGGKSADDKGKGKKRGRKSDNEPKSKPASSTLNSKRAKQDDSASTEKAAAIKPANKQVLRSPVKSKKPAPKPKVTNEKPTKQTVTTKKTTKNSKVKVKTAAVKFNFTKVDSRNIVKGSRTRRSKI